MLLVMLHSLGYVFSVDISSDQCPPIPVAGLVLDEVKALDDRIPVWRHVRFALPVFHCCIISNTKSTSQIFSLLGLDRLVAFRATYING